MPIAIEELKTFSPNLNEIAQQFHGLNPSGSGEPWCHISGNLDWYGRILRVVLWRSVNLSIGYFRSA